MNEANIHGLFTQSAYEFPESARKWMPSWLTQHKGFQQVKNSRIFKVFSLFGISDFREKFEDPSSLEDFKDLILTNLSALLREMSRAPDSPEATRLEQVTYKLLREVMGHAVWKTPKHRVVNQIASEDKKLRIDAGTSVVKAYNMVRTSANALRFNMPDLESSREFKNYSKRADFTVVFSTQPEDIAAMASRSHWGSCQTLHVDKGLVGCVVGSTLSKFIGIAYITTGSQYTAESLSTPGAIVPRGERMEARSLVRFVVDTRTNKPAIVLDRMYPASMPKFVRAIQEAFSKRTSIPVHDLTNTEALGVQPEDFTRFRLLEENIPGIMESEQTYLDAPVAFTRAQSISKDPDDTIRKYNREMYHWLEHKIATFISKKKNIHYESIISTSRELAKNVIMKLTLAPAFEITERYQRGGRPMSHRQIQEKLSEELKRSAHMVKIKKLVDVFFSNKMRRDQYGDMFDDKNFRNDIANYIYYQLIDLPDK